jgi:acetyl-CoA synthetase
MKQIKTFAEYKSEYKKSVDSPEKFWAEVAEDFYWQKKWDKVLDWNFTEPKIKWYEGARLNITENCLDRHIADS